ncbi:MAG: hypothetical protein QOF79_1825 [Actinomycetota bacterium]|jgi:hypothetical protein|nr:hypothetical protein [Actinomycetota bacterium]
MKRFIWLGVGAAALGVVFWFFGLDAVSSAVISLAVVAIGATWMSFPDRRPSVQWPPGPALSLDGARRETAQLSWALSTRRGMTGETVVSETVVARIRTIAIARLLTRQLDLENPQHRAAIVALIGRDTFEVVSHERARPATLSAVLRSLDALDALDTRHKAGRRN